MRPEACELSIDRRLMKMVKIAEAPNVDWINATATLLRKQKEHKVFIK